MSAIEADDSFHRVVLDAAGNQELAMALRRLMPKVRRLDVLDFSGTDAPRDHDAFLDSCRRRAPGEAAAIAEQSFLRRGRQMAAMLEQEAAVAGAGLDDTRGRVTRDSGARS